MFSVCAAHYISTATHKRSLRKDINHLDQLMPYIGDMPIDRINMGSPELRRFIVDRQESGLKTNTINHDLKTLRRILNLAASEWYTDGMTWLQAAPKIKLLPVTDARPPYPISRDEERRLLAELPPHLQIMTLFALQTGAREGEICRLKWSMERHTGRDDGIVFELPAAIVKTQHARLLVVNRVGKSIVDEQRGNGSEYVFVRRGRHLSRINASAWQSARRRAGVPLRVHDLRHTFGQRARAAGVDLETRADLLGHEGHKRMTTHYSAPEIGALIDAANRICDAEIMPPRLAAIGSV